jgi:uncharacterized protein YjbJ (UPF0337 family)
MSNELIQASWIEIKRRIQAKWGKLSNSEIESLKDNIDGLSKKLQKVYGYAKAQAEREYHEFRITLRPIKHSVGNPVSHSVAKFR